MLNIQPCIKYFALFLTYFCVIGVHGITSQGATSQTTVPYNLIEIKEAYGNKATSETNTSNLSNNIVIKEFSVPVGSRPHDVAPAQDGSIWYTAQGSGEIGKLDPISGKTEHIKLGPGSSPHGVIVGPDNAPWITDSGLNAIIRVDPDTKEITTFPLPTNSSYANLNTATFDKMGILWFTGQNGFYGSLDPSDGKIELFEAPKGRGPYGITTTPNGTVFYASLAGNYIAEINIDTGNSSVIQPPTPDQGARRVWSDSQGNIWVSEWNAGKLAVYIPSLEKWKEWELPSENSKPYAVYVDKNDIVWISDFGVNALIRFDPSQESFKIFKLPTPDANVRQLLGRTGEVWGAESGTDKLVMIQTTP